MFYQLLLSIAFALPVRSITPLPSVKVKPAHTWEPVTVTKVYDGDTFNVTRSSITSRIRITWVDTPELKTKEFYSKEASEILAKALADGSVEIQIVGKSFDRDVANVRTKSIPNVGLYMIQRGAGVAYPTCRRECPETWAMVQKAEATAKASKLGIWQK